MAVCATFAFGDPRATSAIAEGDKDSRTRLCAGLAPSSCSIRSLTDIDLGAIRNLKFALVPDAKPGAGVSNSRAEQLVHGEIQCERRSVGRRTKY